MNRLPIEPLSRVVFQPFGDVIDSEGAQHFTINEGNTERFHDLAGVDVVADGGRPLINIFRAQPRAYPFTITMMERHPLGSQAFIPLTPGPFLVVVAPLGPRPLEDDLRAFITQGSQGINYAPGVWHHPILALGRQTDFLVVDRGGSGENCDIIQFNNAKYWLEPPTITTA